MIANKFGFDVLRSSQGVAHADEMFMMWKSEVQLKHRCPGSEAIKIKFRIV